MDSDDILIKMIASNIVAIVIVMAVFGLVIKAMNQTARDLAHAHKLADDALERQKTFVFSFSHELRNPLNSLLGNLQLILMSTILPQTREMVKTSQICAEILLQLVNNILDVGKCDIGKLEINLSPTKVHDVFERIWAVSIDLIKRKKLRSYMKIEKRVPAVAMLDNHRLNQVMMNLMGNAIKFTDEGLISVTIQWLASTAISNEAFEPKPYDDTNEGSYEKYENLYMTKTMRRGSLHNLDEYHFIPQNENKFNSLTDTISQPQRQQEGALKIIIRDTGCGMNEAALSKLFQRFSQVSTDVHKRQIGTGLGLYISKEVCKKMNGDIRVYSKPGVGTTFILVIPTNSVINDAYLNLDKTQGMLLNGPQQTKLNVMVADDSPFNIRIICGFFGKIEAQTVDTANDGLEAYEKYKKNVESGLAIDVE